MTVDNILAVLGWCMVINFAMMLWAVLMLSVAPDLTYRVQSMFTSIDRHEFDKTMYQFLGYFKLLIIVFNLTPYLALRIVF